MEIEKVGTETSLRLIEISESLAKLSKDINQTCKLKESLHRIPFGESDLNNRASTSTNYNLNDSSSMLLDKNSTLKKSKVSFCDFQNLSNKPSSIENSFDSKSSILRNPSPSYTYQNSSSSKLNQSLYSNMSSRNSLNQNPSYSRSRNLSSSKSNFQTKWLPEFWRSQTSVSPNQESKLRVTQEEFDALRYFPTTLGEPSYSMTIPVQSVEKPQLSSRYNSSRTVNRSYSGSSFNLNQYDSSRYDLCDNVESLHSIIQRAPTTLAASIPELSPFEEHLTQLRLERLQIEEDRLREVLRREELENMRGPEPKWYERKDSSFSYENHKNTQLIRSQDNWTELLKRRENILNESRKMATLYASTPVF